MSCLTERIVLPNEVARAGEKLQIGGRQGVGSQAVKEFGWSREKAAPVADAQRIFAKRMGAQWQKGPS